MNAKLDFSYFTKYLFYENRLKTFDKKWPFTGSENLSPEKMARAGFYYNPDSENTDNVVCPFCMKNLCSWAPNDDPWEEHKKRPENCYLIRLNKEEKDYTVGDFLRLIAFRQASILAAFTAQELEKCKSHAIEAGNRVVTKAQKAKKKKKWQ